MHVWESVNESRIAAVVMGLYDGPRNDGPFNASKPRERAVAPIKTQEVFTRARKRLQSQTSSQRRSEQKRRTTTMPVDTCRSEVTVFACEHQGGHVWSLLVCGQGLPKGYVPVNSCFVEFLDSDLRIVAQPQMFLACTKANAISFPRS